MRVIVLADTHLREGITDRLPPQLLSEIDAADRLLHAGDLVSAQCLDELSARVPTEAVLGNNDRGLSSRLPERLELEIGGVHVAMVHDSGDRRGREARLRRLFPVAQIVVFGHSHVPCDETGLVGQRLFNPGSATTRRGQPRCSYGWLELAGGQVAGHGIEYL